MAEEQFSLTYDGPALQNNRMDVRDLAPALLSLGALFSEAQEVADPDAPRVALDIQATGRGSFDVSLVISQLQGQEPSLLVREGAQALANLFGILFGFHWVGKGLFWLIKWTNGSDIQDAQEIAPGMVRVTVEGTSAEVPAEVLNLHRVVSIRRRASQVVAPLARDGIERMEIRKNEELVVSLGKNDVPAFEAAAIGEPIRPIIVQSVEQYLRVISPVLEGKDKWKLHDGRGVLTATIEDEAFLARRETGERFGQGDVLRSRLRIEQYLAPDGKPKARYVVEEVIEHIVRPPQSSFPLSGH